MCWGETLVEIAAKSIEKGIQGEVGAALWAPPSKGVLKFFATAGDLSMFPSPCYIFRIRHKYKQEYETQVPLPQDSSVPDDTTLT